MDNIPTMQYDSEQKMPVLKNRVQPVGILIESEDDDEEESSAHSSSVQREEYEEFYFDGDVDRDEDIENSRSYNSDMDSEDEVTNSSTQTKPCMSKFGNYK